MTTDTNPNLKEARHHGTNAFPCGTYHTVCQKRGMLVKHHWHEEIEIIHFINGHFRLIINMEVYEIKEECIFFIQPLELHAITIVSGNEATEDAIVFLPSMLSFDSYDHAQLHLIQPLINHELSFPRKLTPDHLAYSDILKTFSTIVSSFESYDHLEPQSVQTEDVSAQLTIKASLLTMLSILSKFTLFQKADITSDKRIDFIKAALLYIKEHYREKIYL
ncbi:MAG: hypothetical protein PWP24_258, partial [Clostridiales bacterium]|nr:hypothetical protein [Clostridiales bacterium]